LIQQQSDSLILEKSKGRDLRKFRCIVHFQAEAESFAASEPARN
jgi:hypothetical protein